MPASLARCMCIYLHLTHTHERIHSRTNIHSSLSSLMMNCHVPPQLFSKRESACFVIFWKTFWPTHPFAIIATILHELNPYKISNFSSNWNVSRQPSSLEDRFRHPLQLRALEKTSVVHFEFCPQSQIFQQPQRYWSVGREREKCCFINSDICIAHRTYISVDSASKIIGSFGYFCSLAADICNVLIFGV